MKRPALRMLTGTADQILSSLSNALIVFTVARTSSVADFGMASVLFSLTTATLAVTRAAIGTPVLLLAGRHSSYVLRHTRTAAGAALLFGIAMGGVLAGISLLLPNPNIGLGFAVAIPLLLTQDSLRFSAIALGRTGAAFWSDAVWTVASLGLLCTALLDRRLLPVEQVISLWAVSAGVALIVLLVQLRLFPAWHGLAWWWRNERPTRLRFALESCVDQFSVIVVVLLSTVAVGSDAAAALRGAVTILGPFAILANALNLIALPEAGRAQLTTVQLWRRLRLVALPISVAAIAIGAVAPFIPPSIGALALGDSWVPAAHVLPIIGVEYAALTWVGLVYNLLRYHRAANQLLRARMIQTGITIAACFGAALVFHSALAVAVGLAVSACLNAGALLVWVVRDLGSPGAQSASSGAAATGGPLSSTVDTDPERTQPIPWLTQQRLPISFPAAGRTAAPPLHNEPVPTRYEPHRPPRLAAEP
ncbi:MAG: hypothetical protein JWN03_8414 [Nocardia sp.]|uniref:hypothetical protein n=1 Tax=Nocardia sp. TaxID=1821 RepID=UPI00262C001B|nr:hypothetical protein [Nocardia sp.]MCU1648139.1 hypothetical protein [Nocardia sp.]